MKKKQMNVALLRSVIFGVVLSIGVLFYYIDSVFAGHDEDAKDERRMRREERRLSHNSWKKRKETWLKNNRWGSVDLIGNIPSYYLTRKTSDRKYRFVKLSIRDGVIESIQPLKSVAEAMKHPDAVMLWSKKSKKRVPSQFDVMYPGLIDLHNHTKYNNLPLWDLARGGFANRFEWRPWSKYKQAVSGNMNPWAGYGAPATCAAFRWSEIQAMVHGTTYLQGSSSCVENFAIHRVEDKWALKYDKEENEMASVQAPTDIVTPEDFTFVWNVLRPRMVNAKGAIKRGWNYERALKEVITEFCPKLVKKFKISDVNGSAELKILSNRANLDAEMGGHCDKTKYDGTKFLRYVYWHHKSIVGKKRYLQDPKRAGIIGHLAEGRRNDPYNKLEFELVKLLGLDQARVNLVHGVSIDKAGFQHMAKRGMGLVWSPFSNLLLYGETARIRAAKQAGVKIALGSDWTPTGSKGVLEELKIAKRYVMKKGLQKVFSDFDLVQMVTENPAQMISYFEDTLGDGVHGIGTLRPDAMGTLIVVKRNKARPFQNLLVAKEADVNLVVVDGKPIYGNVAYLKQHNANVRYEVLPEYLRDLARLRKDKTISAQTRPDAKEVEAITKRFALAFVQEEVDEAYHLIVKNLKKNKVKSLKEAEKLARLKGKANAKKRAEELAKLVLLGNLVRAKKYANGDRCGFAYEKGFVHQQSKSEHVIEYAARTNAGTLPNPRLNLDRARSIQMLLGINLMSQNRNLLDPKKGNPKAALDYWPPLYTCNEDQSDPDSYTNRLANFIKPKTKKDEMTTNLANRVQWRKDRGLGAVPKRMAEKYGLAYDETRDY